MYFQEHGVSMSRCGGRPGDGKDTSGSKGESDVKFTHQERFRLTWSACNRLLS